MILSREKLESLAKVRGVCLSMYLPTVMAGREVQQNRIRFKNQLAEAQRQLAERIDDDRYVDIFLKPARKLLDKDDFWQHQGAGLAVLLGEDRALEYRTPLVFPEQVVVANRFHLKPLVPLVNEDGTYYILVLGMKGVRLIRASREGARELDAADLPRDVRDVVGYDYEEKSLQFHSFSGSGGGGQAVFHGQGSGKDDRQEELRRFLKAVAQGVNAVLGSEPAPILLASTTENAARFRAEAGWRRIMDQELEGDFSRASVDEIHARSLEAMKPWFRKKREEAKEKYRDSFGIDPGRTTSAPEEAVVAADDGRVETLILNGDDPIWGTYDPEARKVSLHEERREGDEDLLDLACSLTLVHGGAVHPVPAREVPGEGPLAAVLRY